MINNKTLALDLEGTLIDNALDNNPRPGLYDFLESCMDLFDRIVIMTAIDYQTFSESRNYLVANNYVPKWFDEIQYVHYNDMEQSNYGEFKDLRCIPNDNLINTFILDDMESNIRNDQKTQWLYIKTFYGSKTDAELYNVIDYMEWLLQDNLDCLLTEYNGKYIRK